MRKPLVVLKTGEPVANVAAERGQFADMIRATLGAAWTGDLAVVDVRDERPPDPASAAAFVITGSAANVPTREPWMLRTEAWLRDAVRAGAPTFGICFGHQILAQALGGEVQRNPRGREIGTVHIERLADDPLFEGIPERFEANATHVDSVVRLPPDAVVLARSSLDDRQAVRFGPRCYGVQFHPEIDAWIMRGYIEARREILTSEGFPVSDLLGGVREAELARRTLTNFIRHVVGA